MTELLIASNVLLWIAVVVLALIVFALTRQVGILHERIAPAGALQPTSGPKVGEHASALDVTSLSGDALTIGGASNVRTLVLFVSPTCPVCKALVPTARSLAKHESLRLIFASDGDSEESHRSYVRDLGLDAYPYVLSQTLGLHYGVSKLPFALLLGEDGTLLSKGLVNSREHLESLIEAVRTGVASIQDYVSQFDPKLYEEAR